MFQNSYWDKRVIVRAEQKRVNVATDEEYRRNNEHGETQKGDLDDLFANRKDE